MVRFGVYIERERASDEEDQAREIILFGSLDEKIAKGIYLTFYIHYY